jgi:hypothetical protein
MVLLLAGTGGRPALVRVLSRPRMAIGQGPLAGFEELSRYQDDDPYRFGDALARTRSLYLSAGTGEGGLLALGLNALRLEQEWWAHETQRMLLMTELPVGPALSHGLLNGFTSCGYQEHWGDGASVGGGLGQGRPARCLPSIREAGLAAALDRAWRRAMPATASRPWWAAGAVRNQAGAVGWELGWLGQRRQGEICHGGRALWRLPCGPGPGCSLHGLGGRQEVWYDSDRLVLHDSGQALTGMASAALEPGPGTSPST